MGANWLGLEIEFCGFGVRIEVRVRRPLPRLEHRGQGISAHQGCVERHIEYLWAKMAAERSATAAERPCGVCTPFTRGKCKWLSLGERLHVHKLILLPFMRRSAGPPLSSFFLSFFSVGGVDALRASAPRALSSMRVVSVKPNVTPCEAIASVSVSYLCTA